MARRNYKIRINVHKLTDDRLHAMVSLADDVIEMFGGKPYVSVKRMQDRLAFVPWDNKTGRGMVAISNNSLQFGVQSDCEKMKDFCGEYTLVGNNESGIVYVKLEDRRPFEREYEREKGIKHDKVAEESQSAVTGKDLGGSVGLDFASMIEQRIKEKQEEIRKADEEVTAAQTILDEAKERLSKLNNDLRSYYTVLCMERGDK